MMLILLRVATAPLLVGAGSLAQRRWGQSIGGRIMGLPLTSLPLLFLMCLAQGRSFAASAATATLAAGLAQSGWALSYVIAAGRMGPARSSMVATAVFGVVCLMVYGVPLAPLPAAVISAGSIFASLLIWPRVQDVTDQPAPVRHELVFRMVAAAAFTLGLSESAHFLGARPAGLVGALPVLSVVLTVGSHHSEGAGAASRFLRGVMEGSLSVVAGLAVLALILPVSRPELAFPLAVAGSLAAQLIPVAKLNAALRASLVELLEGRPGHIF